MPRKAALEVHARSTLRPEWCVLSRQVGSSSCCGISSISLSWPIPLLSVDVREEYPDLLDLVNGIGF
jgi:hypothetical protein